MPLDPATMPPWSEVEQNYKAQFPEGNAELQGVRYEQYRLTGSVEQQAPDTRFRAIGRQLQQLPTDTREAREARASAFAALQRSEQIHQIHGDRASWRQETVNEHNQLESTITDRLRSIGQPGIALPGNEPYDRHNFEGLGGRRMQAALIAARRYDAGSINSAQDAMDFVPFARTGFNVARLLDVNSATRRIEAGHGTDEDYSTVAASRIHGETERNRGGLLNTLRSLPATAIELAIPFGVAAKVGTKAAELFAGRIPSAVAGVAGRAAGLTATNMLPSAVEHGIQRNIQEGRNPWDPRALPGALANTFLQAAAFEAIGAGRWGASRTGMGGAVRRFISREAAGMSAEQVGNLLSYGVDTAIEHTAGRAWNMRTEYGAFGHALKGEWGPMWEHLGMSAITNAAFAGLHEAREPGAHPSPETMNRPIDTLIEQINEAHRRGIPRDDVPAYLREIEFTGPDMMERARQTSGPAGHGLSEPSGGFAPETAPGAPRTSAEPVVAPEATREPVVPAATEPVPRVGRFTTEKGSTYQVHEDGTTTRTKAKQFTDVGSGTIESPGHEGDEGAKERSARTVYVPNNMAQALSAAGEQGHVHTPRVIVHGDYATLLTFNPLTGRWAPRGSGRNVPIFHEPAVGLQPLELWKPSPVEGVPGATQYRGHHAGHAIVSMEPVPPKPVEPTPVARPSHTPERVEELRQMLVAVGAPAKKWAPERVIAEAQALGLDRAQERVPAGPRQPDVPPEAVPVAPERPTWPPHVSPEPPRPPVAPPDYPGTTKPSLMDRLRKKGQGQTVTTPGQPQVRRQRGPFEGPDGGFAPEAPRPITEARRADLVERVIAGEGGLTPEEQLVLTARLMHATGFREIGQGMGISHEQARLLEKSGLAKLGHTGTVADLHAATAGAVVDKVLDGKLVPVEDLHLADPTGEVHNRLAAEIAAVHSEADVLHNEWAKAKKHGKLTPQREAEIRAKLAGLRTRLDALQGPSRPSAGQPKAAETVPAEPAERVPVKPPPVHEPGERSVPGSPAASGPAPADEGTGPPAQRSGEGASAAADPQAAAHKLNRGRLRPDPDVHAEIEESAHEHGVALQDVYDHANAIAGHDRQAVAEHNAFLREARSALGEWGNFSIGREKYSDSTSVPHLDEVADSLSQKPQYAHYFNTDRELATETLFRMLKEGNLQAMSTREVLRHAVANLYERRIADEKALAQSRGEDVSQAEQMVRDGVQAGSAPEGDEAAPSGRSDADEGTAAERSAGPTGGGDASDLPFRTASGTLGKRAGSYRFGQPERPGELPGGVAHESSQMGHTGWTHGEPVSAAELNELLAKGHVESSWLGEKGKAALDRANRFRQHVWDGIRRIGGAMFPETSRLDSESGNALSRQVSANIWAHEQAPLLIDKVMGPKPKDVSQGDWDFQRLRVGATLTERRLRFMKMVFTADGDKVKAASVRTIIGQTNSPFHNETEYQAALADPHIRDAINRFNHEVVPVMESMFRRAQGLGPTDPINSRTQIPNQPMHLKRMTGEEPATPSTVMFKKAPWDLRRPKQQKYGFAREASGDAPGYDVDLGAIIEHSIGTYAEGAAQAEAYRTLEAAGLAKWITPGEQVTFQGQPAHVLKDVMPPKGTQTAQAGEVHLAVDPRIGPEVHSALGTDHRPFGKLWGADVLTKATLASTVEMLYHGRNLGTMLFKPGMSMNPLNYVREAMGYVKGDMQTRERLVELARIGAMKPEGMEAATPFGQSRLNPLTWGRRVLDVMDRTMRLQADAAYSRLVERGDAQPTEEGRRDFINQLGQYNKKAQSRIVQLLRETGIGPFATAGTNYAAQGAKALALDPGVRATSWGAAARLRGEYLAKLIAIPGAVAIANYMLWGRADGDDKTPVGGLKVGDAGGKSQYLDMLGATGVTRGMRLFGVHALMEGLRTGAQARGTTGGDIREQAFLESAHSLLHPAEGPIVNFASVLGTGANSIGHRVAPRGEQAPHFGAAALEANPVIGTVFNQEKGPAWSRLLGPYGLRESAGPPGQPHRSITVPQRTPEQRQALPSRPPAFRRPH